MKHPLAHPAWLSAIVVLAALAPASARDDRPAPPDADALVKQLSGESPAEALQAAMRLDAMLRTGDKAADETAAKVLTAKEQVIHNKDVLSLLSDDLAKKPVLAARLVAAVARAQGFVARFKKGSVVVGQVVVEGGKTDPEDVLAQMPILPEGYYAGEVGDLKQPISFRAPGCENLDVPLDGKSGELVYAGKAVLKPLKKENAASLKGALVLDAAKTPEGAVVTLSMSVPPPNTPHNGYSPRPRWPEGVTFPVSKAGEFTVTGLSPAAYYLSITADGHTPYSTNLSLKPGEEHDAGTIHLRATDVGYYIGKPAPKVEKLTWEKDYAAALARAKEEKKPILVMETATWCGWCKKLEADTLDDPWVRHTLSDYVLVKAFEDKEVEGKYGCDGYPTLVFTDSAGKMAHKVTGYMQTTPFLEQCALADQKLGVVLPQELTTLAEKKIISIDAAPAAVRHATQEPDKADEELKWAKGVAEDFLAAMQAGDEAQAKLLMSKELLTVVDADFNWFNNFRSAGFTLAGGATIAEEEMSPTKDEAAFRGRLEGLNSNRKPVQSRFVLRVAADKESKKWRVAFFTFGEPTPGDQKP